MKIWRREDDLERELRARRPEARREFVDELASRIVGQRYRRPARSLRLGVALALTSALLVALGSFGSLGFAASSVTQAVQSVVHVVAPAKAVAPARVVAPAKQSTASSSLSSAMVQYKVTMCFHGHTISVDSHAAGALTAAGATPGSCTGARLPAANLKWTCFKGRNVQVAAKDLAALRKLGFKAGFCKK